jgi:hypothetical protein
MIFVLLVVGFILTVLLSSRINVENFFLNGIKIDNYVALSIVEFVVAGFIVAIVSTLFIYSYAIVKHFIDNLKECK